MLESVNFRKSSWPIPSSGTVGVLNTRSCELQVFFLPTFLSAHLWTRNLTLFCPASILWTKSEEPSPIDTYCCTSSSHLSSLHVSLSPSPPPSPYPVLLQHLSFSLSHSQSCTSCLNLPPLPHPLHLLGTEACHWGLEELSWIMKKFLRSTTGIISSFTIEHHSHIFQWAGMKIGRAPLFLSSF